jgi:hypothetical protein
MMISFEIVNNGHHFLTLRCIGEDSDIETLLRFLRFGFKVTSIKYEEE